MSSSHNREEKNKYKNYKRRRRKKNKNIKNSNNNKNTRKTVQKVQNSQNMKQKTKQDYICEEYQRIMKEAYICESNYINYLISESKKLKMSSDLNDSISSAKKKGRAPGSKKMDCQICDQHFFKVENYEKHIADHQAKGELQSQPSQEDGNESHSLLAAEQSTQPSQQSQDEGMNTADFDSNLSPSRRS